MKRRVVASNESYSSDEGIENNLIEELNEDEQELVSPRKRLRSNTQPEEQHKDASLSEEEIHYDDGDVDISGILSGKFKPDPFGRRASGDINREQKPTEHEDGPQTRSRRTRKFESHLQSLKNNDLPEKMGTKYSRLKRGSEEKSDEDDIANDLSNVEEDENEQEEDYGEYSSSESDASYEPNNEEKANDKAQDIDVSDEEMHEESELQGNGVLKESDQSDLDDLTTVQRPKSRPATRSSARLKEEDGSHEEEINEELSISGEESVPFTKRSVRGKRKREILSDEEVDDEEPRSTRRTKTKKPRIIEEELSQQENRSASGYEEDDGADKEAEEDDNVNERSIDDEDSIDLQSEAEEDEMHGLEEDDFERVPGDWRDFLDELHKTEAMVEVLRSNSQTKKRRVANKQYSGALEQLLYFTDHTNDMGQIFVSSVSHTTFLQRIARTWTVFLKEVGLRLEQNQIDSILRTFVRCHRRPYLKVASAMWKYLFTKKERVYPLTQDELLDICSPKAKLTVERQVQYLWLAKRLRNHEQDFESLMLCCAMGEFYKQRYPKKRTAQIEVWENELHQRFVTHMLTLAASPLRVINEMSLFNDACWKYVSIVASNPMAYMDLKLSEGVKRDFVSRFVLHYVIKYTRTQYFCSIKDKCEKLRRAIRTEFPFVAAFDCIVNPVFDNFVRLADNGCVWLQNIVLERLLLFNPGAARPTEIFKVLVHKRLWDIAISSVLSSRLRVNTYAR